MMHKLRLFLQNYRRPVLCAGLALAMLALLFCVWLTAVQPAQGKATSTKLNDLYDSALSPLSGPVSQTFSCDQPLYGLAFVFEIPGEQPVGPVHLTLYNDATGEVLSTSTGDMGYIISGQYTGFGLDTPVPAGAATRYRVELSFDYQDGARLGLWYSRQTTMEGQQLTVEGAAQPGTLALLATTGLIGTFVTRYFWAFGCGLILLVCGAYWLAAGKRLPLHRLYLILVLLLGLLFTMVLPPYAAPDEQFHINQAFSVASRASTIISPSVRGLQAVPLSYSFRRAHDVDPLVQDAQTSVFTWQRYMQQMFSTSPDAFGQVQYFDEPQAQTDSTLYWCSGLGVFLGFALRLGFVPTLLLGRLANLLAFAFLTAWAVRIAPFGKRLFAAAGLLPMTLHLAASYSRDSLLLALCFAFTALCLRCAFGQTPAGKHHYAVLAVLGVLIAPSKLVYLPLLGLIFLIPKQKLGRYSALWKAGFCALCLVAFLHAPDTQATLRHLAGSVIEASQALPEQNQAASAPLADSEQPPADATGGTAPAAPAVNPDAITFSPAYILRNPGTTLKLLVRSLIQNGDHYLKGLVGGNLSYYSLDLAWGWVLALYALLAFALLGSTPQPLSGNQRILCALLGLACCGLTVLGCITWTPTYYETIYGLQGRYFLPLLPMFLVALRPRAAALQPVRPAHGTLAAFVAVDAGLLLNAFLAVLAR